MRLTFKGNKYTKSKCTRQKHFWHFGKPRTFRQKTKNKNKKLRVLRTGTRALPVVKSRAIERALMSDGRLSSVLIQLTSPMSAWMQQCQPKNLYYVV